MKDLIRVLKKHDLTIASIESLTGGLFASELVSNAGASDVFLGSIVSYANIIKQEVLKIDLKFIEEYGVVSKEIASLMAINGSTLLGSDVTVSFTGNAGPDTLENKDLGLIYTCIKVNNQIFNFKDKLSGNRNKIRHDIVNLLKNRIIVILEKKGE